MSNQNLIKIRIPVVVGSNGRWSAYGYPSSSKDPDWALMEENVLDFPGAQQSDLNANISRLWVEVEIPIPEMPVLKGTVIDTSPLIPEAVAEVYEQAAAYHDRRAQGYERSGNQADAAVHREYAQRIRDMASSNPKEQGQ